MGFFNNPDAASKINPFFTASFPQGPITSQHGMAMLPGMAQRHQVNGTDPATAQAVCPACQIRRSLDHGDPRTDNVLWQIRLTLVLTFGQDNIQDFAWGQAGQNADTAHMFKIYKDAGVGQEDHAISSESHLHNSFLTI